MAAQLTVLSEDYQILPYLNKNGLYPTKLVFRLEDMIDSLAFANEDTIYLIIVHSLTRFTYSELRLLYDDLTNAMKSGGQVILMTDIELTSPDFVDAPIQIVLYDGDLFYGNYTFYKDNVPCGTCEGDKIAVAGRTKKELNLPKTRKDFWMQLCEFATPCKTMIGELPEYKYYDSSADKKYQAKLVSVDLFGDYS